MKKILSLFLIFAAVTLPMAVGASNSLNELPSSAKTTINKYFGKSKVNHVKIDRKMIGGAEYDVVLTNGTEIQFDSKGNWNEISFGTNKLPKGLLPASITDYIKKNFKKQNVSSVSQKRNKYDISLSNGTKLEFDRSGIFSSINNGTNKLPNNILPKSINDYLKTYFKKQKVVGFTLDAKDYEVRLSDGTLIEFDSKGNMEDIELGNNKVPNKLLPKEITDYVKKNYKKQKITGISAKRGGYEIKLSNGTEIDFSADGQVRRLEY